MISDRRSLRVASVAYWDAFATDGVTRKLAGQVASWQALGSDARLFMLSREAAGDAESTVGDETHTFASPSRRFAATRDLVRGVRRFAPDIVYLRYDLFLPPLASSSFGHLPLVIELNTLDRVEFRTRSAYTRAYNRFNRARLLGSAAGVVGVTHEIVRDTVEERPNLPSRVIANSIDPHGVPSLPAPTNEHPRLCFLGSPGMRWHGVDKLVSLARLRPSWQIDVIGLDRVELGDEAPENITAHGFLKRSEYLTILSSADAAVGTLALHRKGMSEACPLKTPEYLLAGIPTIIAYRDTNFYDLDPWYLLRLPNTEDNVLDNVLEIERWLENVRGRRVPRAEVELRVSFAAKESERLDFLDSLIGHPSAPQCLDLAVVPRDVVDGVKRR